MLKMGHIRIILIFLLSVALHVSAQSQNRKYLIITGKILSGLKIIENGSVQIAENTKSPVISQVPEHGRFRLELNYNSEYRLIFSQKGFLPKTILVNTGLPEDAMKQTENFPHFLMTVWLFKDDQDAANVYPENLIQQITYSPEKNDFARVPTIYDVQFVEKGNSNLNQQAANPSQESKTKIQSYQSF